MSKSKECFSYLVRFKLSLMSLCVRTRHFLNLGASLQQESNSSDSGSITLAQAEQQAGYHLFSIPASETGYQLLGVDALGAPGNQIYALNYTMGSTTFTISEGKPLANLPVSGQRVGLRGTTATLSSSNGSSTLTWTEKGIGIQIAGKLSNQQIEAIAKLLS